MRRVLVIILILVVTTSCGKEPIKVGFIGDLSSKNAQLAIDGRNGLDQAVAEINEAGGINGRQVELVVKDDGANVEMAKLQHQAFKDEGVQFVIGHLNSNMVDAVSYSQGNDMLFVSPSMSTDRLNDIDDFVVRTAPINSLQAIELYEYCLENDVKDMVIVYDKMNEEYTKNLHDNFKRYYENAGFKVKVSIQYDSREDDLKDVAETLKSYEPDNVFIIAQATDTAYMMQSLAKDGYNVDGYSVSWSMTGDLIANGGAAVDGMKFIGIYIPEELSQERKDFEEEFRGRYAYDSTFISILCYDAFTALAEGLESADKLNPASVRDAIIQIGEFEGLNENFTMNAYGDSDRSYMVYNLQDGQFVPIYE